MPRRTTLASWATVADATAGATSATTAATPTAARLICGVAAGVGGGGWQVYASRREAPLHRDESSREKVSAYRFRRPARSARARRSAVDGLFERPRPRCDARSS